MKQIRDADAADPFVLLAEGRVGADGAEAGLTANRQLAEHDDRADEDNEQQIDYEECEAAVVAHFVGEAPDVAQADRRTDGGHEKAEVSTP